MDYHTQLLNSKAQTVLSANPVKVSFSQNDPANTCPHPSMGRVEREQITHSRRVLRDVKPEVLRKAAVNAAATAVDLPSSEPHTVVLTEGTKYDEGKPQWHLLPLEMLEGVVRVLMAGAKKYDEWNWSKGIKVSRLLNATLRHLREVQAGRDYDEETALLHVDHAITNLLFLRHQLVHAFSYTSDNKQLYRAFDDRTRVGRLLNTDFKVEDDDE